ncbi:MAG TPA: hypothetical protein VN137_00905 [Sphingomonas sp.]|nr:hypothetical protein [Sphingomonas sp.]
MKRATASIVAIGLLSLTAAVKPSRDRCLDKMQHAAVAGKVGGAIFCDGGKTTFRLVGRTAGVGYHVYDYRYRFMAANVMHGGQRIIIFRAHKYVGQYPLRTPPFTNMTARGSHLILSTGRTEVSLNLSKNLPARILVNGEEEQLSR